MYPARMAQKIERKSLALVADLAESLWKEKSHSTTLNEVSVISGQNQSVAT